MPNICFSYEDGMPRTMPATYCFRYEADAPRSMPHACLSYPQMCFGYPADVPPGTRNPDAAQPGLRGMPLIICFSYPGHAPRGMPVSPCFSYPADVLPGDGVEPDLGGPLTMPHMCFRY